MKVQRTKSFFDMAVSGLLSLFLVVPLACSNNGGHELPPDFGNEIERANYLIDQRQFSEAIYILTERLKRDPANLRARVVLASAYAARAGVAMAQFEVFAHEIDKWNQIEILLPNSNEGLWLNEVAKITFRLQVALQALEVVPTIFGPEALKDVETGLHTLDEAGRIEGGPSLYRALLRIALLKVQIQANYRPVFASPCRMNVEALTKWLTSVSNEMVVIVEDVAFGQANPESRARTLKFAGDLKANLAGVLRGKSLSPLGELAPLGRASPESSPALPSEIVEGVGEATGVDIPFLLRRIYGRCQ